MKDRKDDIKLGLGSTAVLFGDYLKPILSFFAFVFIALLTYAGHVNQQGALYYLVSVGSAAIHIMWQLATVDFDDRISCMETFIVSQPTKGIYNDSQRQYSRMERWVTLSGQECCWITATVLGGLKVSEFELFYHAFDWKSRAAQ